MLVLVMMFGCAVAAQAAIKIPFIGGPKCKAAAGKAYDAVAKAEDARFLFEANQKYYTENKEVNQRLRRLGDWAGRLPTPPDPSLEAKAKVLEAEADRICGEERKATLKDLMDRQQAIKLDSLVACRNRVPDDGEGFESFCKGLGIEPQLSAVPSTAAAKSAVPSNPPADSIAGICSTLTDADWAALSPICRELGYVPIKK
ncbi:MAG: hypothetical protein A2751_01575 [Candidatus Doudnabacteria bacterium RIFCSPHIGHO2_01_FULL_46_14]|uniref:DUF5667 domain-containing protein n=1 Tax=Candidatus Doudnabacteria bacterium RIFCSPHIGHO2_01_FULL_46_14 TaxID=1817824 RepID=A0A1F5NJ89_9BACT|nr:MAG: hypothetical protein A2751_01575 [Candidatus Doudnabacteria bacterium RIFCSPHIGHO2_01_FULL_46_14]